LHDPVHSPELQFCSTHSSPSSRLAVGRPRHYGLERLFLGQQSRQRSLPIDWCASTELLVRCSNLSRTSVDRNLNTLFYFREDVSDSNDYRNAQFANDDRTVTQDTPLFTNNPSNSMQTSHDLRFQLLADQYVRFNFRCSVLRYRMD
jgi:hypothetical protein